MTIITDAPQNLSPPELINENRRGQRASPRLDSTDLFAQSSMVVIDHGGEEYRLRLTSKGKLILTK